MVSKNAHHTHMFLPCTRMSQQASVPLMCLFPSPNFTVGVAMSVLLCFIRAAMDLYDELEMCLSYRWRQQEYFTII